MYCYSMTYYALTDKLSPSCARAGIDEVLSSSVEGVIACKSAAELGANILSKKPSFCKAWRGHRDRTRERRRDQVRHSEWL